MVIHRFCTHTNWSMSLLNRHNWWEVFSCHQQTSHYLHSQDHLHTSWSNVGKTFFVDFYHDLGPKTCHDFLQKKVCNVEEIFRMDNFWYQPAITILCLWGRVPNHVLNFLTSETCPVRVKSPAWIRTSPSGRTCFILDVWLWVSLTQTILIVSSFGNSSFFSDLNIETLSD